MLELYCAYVEAAVTDHRITLINQVVSGIRAIKSNVWEDEYRGKIKNVRR